MWRETTVAFQQWVVDERFQENSTAARSEHANDLRNSKFQFQMMQDLLTKHGIKNAIPEGKLFSCALH